MDSRLVRPLLRFGSYAPVKSTRSGAALSMISLILSVSYRKSYCSNTYGCRLVGFLLPVSRYTSHPSLLNFSISWLTNTQLPPTIYYGFHSRKNTVFCELINKTRCFYYYFYYCFFLITYHSAPVIHTDVYAPHAIPTMSGEANSLMELTPSTKSATTMINVVRFV